MRDGNDLKEKSKGKTKEGASEPLTMGDLQSHRRMFNLIKNTFPDVTVSTTSVTVVQVFNILNSALTCSSFFFQSISVDRVNSRYVTEYPYSFGSGRMEEVNHAQSH